MVAPSKRQSIDLIVLSSLPGGRCIFFLSSPMQRFEITLFPGLAGARVPCYSLISCSGDAKAMFEAPRALAMNRALPPLLRLVLNDGSVRRSSMPKIEVSLPWSWCGQFSGCFGVRVKLFVL